MSTTPPPTPTDSRTSPAAGTDPVLSGLRLFAAATALLAIVQALMGMGILGSLGGVFGIHRTLGFISLGAAVLAAIFAVVWSTRSGNKGLMFHAISVAVLALAQIGLGEMGLRWVHVGVGLLYLVAAVALGTLSFRRGGAGRAQRRAEAARTEI